MRILLTMAFIFGALFLVFQAKAQQLGPYDTGCPARMLPGGGGYCIDINPSRREKPLEEASRYCASRGTYLCSAGQWSSACAMQTGLNGMFNSNSEWTADGFTMQNDNSCYDENRGVNSSSHHRFRCCR